MRIIYALMALYMSTVFLSGCAQLQDILSPQKPGIELSDGKLEKIDFNKATVLTTVNVDNPNSVPMKIAGLTYVLAVNGETVAEGENASDVNVPAAGTGSIDARTNLVFAEMIKQVPSLKPGNVVDLDISGEVRLMDTALGPLTLPYRASLPMPIPAPPTVEMQDFTVKNMSLDEIAAELVLEVTNNNQFEVSIDTIQYELELAGKVVSKAGTIDEISSEAIVLEPGKPMTIRFPFEMEPRSIGFAGIQMVTRKKAEYKLTGEMVLGSEFGTFPVKIDKRGEKSLGSS